MPIWCLMTDEVQTDFYTVGLFCSLFGQFISHIILKDVCVGFDFVDGEYCGGRFLGYLLFGL